MIIAVAGPYSADTQEQRTKNLNNLNIAAGKLLERGHIPVIGVNAALPVVQYANIQNPYDAIMNISMAVIQNCDALLLIAESPGANRERDYTLSKNKSVYYNIDEVPNN